jgi:HEPN domain-containing protein
MADRSGDWLAQAERDLAMAERARSGELHEWACFAAQQAAEKALKAAHLARGQEAWGHVVAELLDALAVPPPAGLRDKALVLDGYYIPTRYANGHAAGPPSAHYGDLQSREAIAYAREVVGFARVQMAGPGAG